VDTPTAARTLADLTDLTTPMALRAAVTLRLPHRAGPAGATAQRLADETGTRAPVLRRLLEHLVTVGVFERDADRYRTTELGQELCANDMLTLRLDVTTAAGRADLAFVELPGALTTGETAYRRRYGREFWDDLDADPHLRRTFDLQMTTRFRTQAPQIARRYDWSRFATVVDVGGGDGTVAAAILQAHPTVRATVLDLPPTAAAAADRFAAAGLSDRATTAPGSFFDALPPGADAYLLSDILHDWDDAHAHTILDRCARAAEPHGTVLVIDAILGRGVDTAMDLSMLTCFDGRERTEAELVDLAAGCGLALRETAPVADSRTLLAFTPA
jgi:hypothetical protein